MSLFDLTGKVAVVTGSSKGIGRAIAERLAEHGAKVVVSSRKADICETVAAGIRARGGEAEVIPCHIARKEELKKLVDQTSALWGGIDIMVSNAAVNPYLGPATGASDEVYERVMGANVRSNFWLANMVCPQMAERGGGSFIIVSSIGGFRGSASLGLYGISKAADMQLARNIAVEWGPKNVRANCIAPGLVRHRFRRARCGRTRCATARRRATTRCSASANRTRSPGQRSSLHLRQAVLSRAKLLLSMVARWLASYCRRTTELTREEAEALDRADQLAAFRGRFVHPDGVIYLDGNSLGLLPKATPARVAQVIEQEWGQSLIRSWTDHGWIDLQFRVGDKIAQLIGAAPGTTVVADSTSVNLFKLLAAALDQRPGRMVILTEEGNFPTDLYIAQGLAALLQRGHELRSVPAVHLAQALDSQVAVLMLTHVNYRSGAMHNMASLTRAAHAAGALVVWDLSHSVGVVPLRLAADEARYGGRLWLQVSERWSGGAGVSLRWAAYADRSAIAADRLAGTCGTVCIRKFYRPATGIARAVVGTPPILSLAALEVGIDIGLEAPIHAIRTKSLKLADLFMALMEQEAGFTALTPTEPALRGSQVSFAHPDGYAIMQSLIGRGVIGDFRAPDVLRFGLAPLYVRFVDVWDAVTELRDVMRGEVWRDDGFQQRRKVT